MEMFLFLLAAQEEKPEVKMTNFTSSGSNLLPGVQLAERPQTSYLLENEDSTGTGGY